MPDRPLIDIVRAAVADVAPDELADFERVARGYAASAARRGWPWHTESSASASVVAGQPVAALVTAVGAELGTDVVLLGARHGAPADRHPLVAAARSDRDRPGLVEGRDGSTHGLTTSSAGPLISAGVGTATSPRAARSAMSVRWCEPARCTPSSRR